MEINLYLREKTSRVSNKIRMVCYVIFFVVSKVCLLSCSKVSRKLKVGKLSYVFFIDISEIWVKYLVCFIPIYNYLCVPRPIKQISTSIVCKASNGTFIRFQNIKIFVFFRGCANRLVRWVP